MREYVEPFQVVPCLDEAAAARAAAAVLLFRDRWRHHFLLDILGTTTHLDYRPPAVHADVEPVKERENAFLRGHFAWLYERVREVLESMLGDPVQISGQKPLPGFMIYTGAVQGDISQRVHVDLQFELHEWRELAAVDYASTLTFTLPLSLPCFSSGMTIWPQSKVSRLLKGGTSRPRVSFGSPSAPRFLPYRVGDLVVHAGTLVHAMDNEIGADLTPRITLQGHALWADEAWHLYW